MNKPQRLTQLIGANTTIIVAGRRTGKNYIKQMKRDLTPLTFQTSIPCHRIGIAKDGFYSSMREGHKYDANDNQNFDILGYDYDFSMLAPTRTLIPTRLSASAWTTTPTSTGLSPFSCATAA